MVCLEPSAALSSWCARLHRAPGARITSIQAHNGSREMKRLDNSAKLFAVSTRFRRLVHRGTLRLSRLRDNRWRCHEPSAESEACGG